MLKDLERIIDEQESAGINGESLEIELRQAARLLWRSQFLYESDWGTKSTYDLIRRHLTYFENLFEALGYRVVGRPNERLIGLLAIDLPVRQSMKLDESLLLLAFRLYYEESLKRFEINDLGEIEVDSETILSIYEERTRRDRLGIVRLNEILISFKQRGLIRYGEKESNRNFTLFLRPALPIVVGEEALASLEEFIKKSGQSGVDTPSTMSEGPA